MVAAWALATPLLSGPDEGQHAIRAAAEVRRTMGEVEWIGFGPVAHARAPEAYRDVLAPEEFEGGDRLVDVTTYEFRPPPPYYWVVGTATLVDPDDEGVYAMRLLSAAVAAGFLTAALLTAPSPLSRAAVAVAATPMTLYLAGNVNPNGVEVAASICAWTATQSLVLASRSLGNPRKLDARTGGAGVSLAVLALLRGFSPVFVAVIVAAMLVRAPGLARRRDVRLAGLAVAVATAASLAWTASIYGHSRIPRDGNGLASIPGRTGDFLREAVGVLGNLDEPVPAVVLVLWAIAAAAVLVLARPGWLTVAVAAVAVAVPAAIDAFDAPSIGFDWQGRYSLPLYAGVVLVAAATSRRAVDARAAGAVAAVAGAGHAIAFVTVGAGAF